MLPPEAGYPRIDADIGAVAAMAAEFDIVVMPRFAILEDADEFVLGAIERAHAAIRFDPDTEIEKIAIGLGSCAQKLAQMAPVHANVMHAARPAEGAELLECRR